MESSLLSGKPSSHALHSGRSLSGDKLGMEGFVTRNLLHGFGAITKPTSENPQGNDGEKSKVSNDKTTGVESESQHGLEEISLELKLGSTTCITQKRKESENPEGNDGEKRKISKDKTRGEISSSFSECKELRPGANMDWRRFRWSWSSVAVHAPPKRGKQVKTVVVPTSLLHPEKTERHNDASLELKFELGHTAMKKTIQTSDIRNSSRLLLPKKWVQENILGLWDARRIGNGIPVGVWDFDTKSEHELIFKYWPGGRGSYVLNRKWTEEFVKRRSLKKGDEIGLYWDPANSRFVFSILNPTPRG